jgi:hypothetical protein
MKMRKNFATYFSVGLAIFALPQMASAATFTVTNTNDSGTGSLRAAILAANGTPGSDIVFNISGSNPNPTWTIQPTSPLPAITANQTVIDGSSQTTFGGDTNAFGPEVVINGSLAGAGASGLRIGTNNSSIRALVINGFDQAGVDINASYSPNALTPTNNRVEGCYLGTSPGGTMATPNSYGVRLYDVDNTTIGGGMTSTRNLISGNSQGGVKIEGGGSQNVVQGNYIGTDRTGTRQIGNHYWGIWLVNSGANSASDVTTIGGTTATNRNLISGNGFANILVDNYRNVRVTYNNIGTDVTGNDDLLDSSEGPVAQQYGIYVNNPSPPASGDVFTIGGSNATRNVIGNHSVAGICLDAASGLNIQSNYIGLGRSGGSNNIGNAIGVKVLNASSGNTIGGSTDTGNIICNSTDAGVFVGGTTGTPQATIRFNSIYNNGGLGIDLGGNGVTANDTKDPDGGPNSLQNFPVLTNVMTNGTVTSITGTLNSTPGTTFTIDYYSSPTADPSGYGEGRVHLLTDTFTLGSDGNILFQIGCPTPVAVGHYVTATITGPSGTSEFSNARVCVTGNFRAAASSGNSG